MVTSHTPSSRGENRIVAAIGNFDGVHLGHRHLINRVGELARNQNAQTGIVLFSPHPRRYFKPDDAPFLLTLPERRDGLLREAGVDQIFSLTFDADFAALAPEAFVEKILIEQLGLSGIVVGRDFRFGKNRAGDVDLLRKVGAASNLEVIDAAYLCRMKQQIFNDWENASTELHSITLTDRSDNHKVYRYEDRANFSCTD